MIYEKFNDAKNGIFTYTHSDNTLSGSGLNGKFKATATGTYTAFTIGGESYAVKAGSDTEVEITSGVWYNFILDTSAKTINFKAGGGLGNSKLALATASTADVLSGKTFYSGNKAVKTGAIPSKGAATYGAKTSAQTIQAGQYLSGAQTIAAVTQSNLSADNIIKGKTVTIASNGSNLWSVAGTGSYGATGTLTLTDGQTTTVKLGFKPSRVVLFHTDKNGHSYVLFYNNGTHYHHNFVAGTTEDGGQCWKITPTSTGFTVTRTGSGQVKTGSLTYVAY